MTETLIITEVNMAKRRGGEDTIVMQTGEYPDGVPKADKPPESKRDRFVRLANNRVNAALKRIGLIRSLGNRNQYEYGPDDHQSIMDALTEAVSAVGFALEGRRDDKPQFRL